MYPASERNRSGFRAMMEIRTSSAHQAIGLTGLAPQQVWKTPVRPVRDQFCRQPSQPPGKFFSPGSMTAMDKVLMLRLEPVSKKAKSLKVLVLGRCDSYTASA